MVLALAAPFEVNPHWAPGAILNLVLVEGGDYGSGMLRNQAIACAEELYRVRFLEACKRLVEG